MLPQSSLAPAVRSETAAPYATCVTAIAMPAAPPAATAEPALNPNQPTQRNVNSLRSRMRFFVTPCHPGPQREARDIVGKQP